ncbi:hypothetical protein ACGYLO_17975 [Sulfitobacter sp. 1A13353]|uniref:hypothetical protein n=1 Tax=Sulfitobacter sp. 1A13353 TaxID=3368568 RepID=UPI00374657D2
MNTSRVDLPTELPWQAAEQESWPETIVFGRLRWFRYTYFVEDTRNPEGRVIEIHGPDGTRLYRGESDVCADTLVRIDMMAKYERSWRLKRRTLMVSR